MAAAAAKRSFGSTGQPQPSGTAGCDRRSPRRPRCWNCGELGHIARECAHVPVPAAGLAIQDVEERHGAFCCSIGRKDADAEAAHGEAADRRSFTVDSGAGHSMVKEVKLLTDIKTCYHIILDAGGKEHVADKCGVLSGYVRNKAGKQRFVSVPDVWHVPGLQRNVLSTGHLHQACGIGMVASGEQSALFDSSGDKIPLYEDQREKTMQLKLELLPGVAAALSDAARNHSSASAATEQAKEQREAPGKSLSTATQNMAKLDLENSIGEQSGVEVVAKRAAVLLMQLLQQAAVEKATKEKKISMPETEMLQEEALAADGEAATADEAETGVSISEEKEEQLDNAAAATKEPDAKVESVDGEESKGGKAAAERVDELPKQAAKEKDILAQEAAQALERILEEAAAELVTEAAAAEGSEPEAENEQLSNAMSAAEESYAQIESSNPEENSGGLSGNKQLLHNPAKELELQHFNKADIVKWNDPQQLEEKENFGSEERFAVQAGAFVAPQLQNFRSHELKMQASVAWLPKPVLTRSEAAEYEPARSGSRSSKSRT